MSTYDRALDAYLAGDLVGAVVGFQEVIAADARHTPAHYHLGLSLHQLGRTDEGITHYRALLKQHPDYLDAWINLGDLCGKGGEPESAIAAWQQALRLDPESVLVLNNLGVTCRDGGHQHEALAYFRQAVSIEPDRPDLWVWIGNLALGLKKFGQAEQAYRQALRLNPGDAQIHNNLAVVLGNLGRETESIAQYRQTLVCDPNLADGLNNLALALHKQHQSDEAESLLRHCIVQHPDYALGWANLGMVLQGIGKLDEAVQVIDRALALTPNQSGWLWNQTLAYLTLGNFERGWQGFEARYAPERNDPNFTDPKLPFPMWGGESLVGKRILLVKEQGFGDQIQCLRFAKDVKAQGATCVGIWVHPALVGIVATTPGIDEVTIEAPTAGYDYWAYLMSLPVRCQASFDSLPGPMPYLYANPAKQGAVQQRIDAFAQGRLRIAINWAGNPSHPNDRNRSLALASLNPWFALQGIAWISLQKDRGPEADAWITQGVLLPLGDEIQDFSDTAAIIAAVDRVVTIDSAVAHLAGALNAPTWLLLPENADYRWMRERTDTPWYPAVQLWRQPKLGDWTPVIARITQQLASDMGTEEPALTNNGPLSLAGAQRLIHGRHGWFAYNRYDQYVGQALERYGEYAEYEVQVFARIMAGHADEDAIEVGSNIGAQSVALARMARRLYAFEPQPVVFHTLCTNLAINDLTNARAFPFGVGETAGQMMVPPVHYCQGGNFGGVSLTHGGDGTPVSIVSLDAFLPELAPDLQVRLIKADVEGMERAVLAGAKALITRDRPFLYVENDRADCSPALIRLLRELGYRLYWHCPLLYNPGNFFADSENVYPGIAAINMLGVPEDMLFDTSGMSEVGAEDAHILRAETGAARSSHATKEGLVTDEEIAAILEAENALPPESHASAPQPRLMESLGSVGPWVKWVMLIALASELLLGLFRQQAS